jgi:hypothetical protein
MSSRKCMQFETLPTPDKFLAFGVRDLYASISLTSIMYIS